MPTEAEAIAVVKRKKGGSIEGCYGPSRLAGHEVWEVWAHDGDEYVTRFVAATARRGLQYFGSFGELCAYLEKLSDARQSSLARGGAADREPRAGGGSNVPDSAYPREFFARSNNPERPGSCFLIMPFAPAFTPVHETIIGALQAPEAGFRCRRADEFFGGHQVMVDILREIATSELILADVTGRNANVFYELGIAHMVKSAARVLLITQRVDDIPFDLRAYRHIRYTRSLGGLNQLRLDLIRSAREVSTSTDRFNVSRGAEHDTGARFPGSDRCLYSIRVSHLMPGRDFAKCMIGVWRHVVEKPAKMVLSETFGLRLGESTPLVKTLPYGIRLDSVEGDTASYSIVPLAGNASARARR